MHRAVRANATVVTHRALQCSGACRVACRLIRTHWPERHVSGRDAQSEDDLSSVIRGGMDAIVLRPSQLSVAAATT